MARVKVNANMIFERYEKKYLLTGKQYEQLMSTLSQYTHPDEYGKYTISSIYYDTDDYSIIRKSLDKPNFKEKLRLRSYGTVGNEDIVYIELKKKFSGVTYKRRMGVALAQAMKYLNNGIIPDEKNADAQIFGEIDWFVKRYKPFAKALLAYDRIALVGNENDELRITLDADIRWRDNLLDLAKGSSGNLLRQPGTRLMEIKIPGALPLWLCNILSNLEIYPVSFSKFGKVYTEHLMSPFKEAVKIAG